MVSELLWPVHTFGPRGRSNRTGALLVVNQDAGNAQLGGTRLVLSPLTAHLNVPRPCIDLERVNQQREDVRTRRVSSGAPPQWRRERR